MEIVTVLIRQVIIMYIMIAVGYYAFELLLPTHMLRGRRFLRTEN